MARAARNAPGAWLVNHHLRRPIQASDVARGTGVDRGGVIGVDISSRKCGWREGKTLPDGQGAASAADITHPPLPLLTFTLWRSVKTINGVSGRVRYPRGTTSYNLLRRYISSTPPQRLARTRSDRNLDKAELEGTASMVARCCNPVYRGLGAHSHASSCVLDVRLDSATFVVRATKRPS
ncbi:hypothetical protein FKP32DRAFT_1278574 [Trametes sanguinea]|nr:hypothetical protein FKP32DRAFT_1278574 [Trametes sanguinea]